MITSLKLATILNLIASWSFLITYAQEQKKHKSFRSRVAQDETNKQRVLLAQSVPEKDVNSPKIAWVLAYPTSGGNYIMDIFHKLTGRTTATNYGHTFEEASGITIRNALDSIPVFTERIHGPFIFTGHLPLPDKTYIPTLSYCGGYCARCFPGRYILKRDEFIKWCVTGTRFERSPLNNGDNGWGWTHEEPYDGNLVHRATVIIRDPIKVVESRFLYFSNVYAGDLDWSQRYDQNRRGFVAYCNEFRVSYADEEEKWWEREIREAGLDIPCYAEVFKYVQWHNLVCESLDHMKKMRFDQFQLDFPFKDFYYEDFEHDFVQSATSLLDFYEMASVVPLTVENQPHLMATSSTSLYTPAERVQVEEFIQKVANPCAWAKLSRYF